MSKRARLSDVARRSRVSPATVSLVLRDKPGIRPETRERVLAAARALGYPTPANSSTRPEPHGTNGDRRPGSFRTIGLVIKATTEQIAAANPFYSYVVAGIEEACRHRRINLLYATLPVDENNLPVEIPLLLTEKQLEGLLLVGTFLDTTVQHVIESQSVPVVLVDAYSDFAYDSIVSDNVSGAYDAVRHLIQCGHRHIGIVGSRPVAYPSIRERRDGYHNALQAHGISETYYADSILMPHDAMEATLQLLKQHPQITALFGCNDEVAIAAMHAAQRLGRRVPDDLSVVGFDDIDLTRHVTPPLTTMHVDKMGMGRIAVQLLQNRALYPDAERVTVLVHTRLMERGTVAAPALDSKT